jgi:hypothetical protein
MKTAQNVVIMFSDADMSRANSIGVGLDIPKTTVIKIAVHLFLQVVISGWHEQKIFYSVAGDEYEVFRTRPVSLATKGFTILNSTKFRHDTSKLMELTKLTLNEVVRNALSFTKDLWDAQQIEGFEGFYAKSLDGTVTKFIFGV